MSTKIQTEKAAGLGRTTQTGSTFNIPLRNTPSQKNVNPIGMNDVSVTDDGVMKIHKGKVYINTEDDDAGVMTPVMVIDEFDNFVEMTRNSDMDDISIAGVYVDNQTIKSITPAKFKMLNGLPTRNINSVTGEMTIDGTYSTD